MTGRRSARDYLLFVMLTLCNLEKIKNLPGLHMQLCISPVQCLNQYKVRSISAGKSGDTKYLFETFGKENTVSLTQTIFLKTFFFIIGSRNSYEWWMDCVFFDDELRSLPRVPKRFRLVCFISINTVVAWRIGIPATMITAVMVTEYEPPGLPNI